ncbi:MAG TPA: DNA polymerase/3'-5' exonuclease PolX [Steroidobacteraceae bacterium]|nr:DNA polymerase/3'-5' exonuclease PolX [Steroidobacteraceae bacterium]HQR48597.1 DNA polymerase/3'-5' exonuclease PolX [Steroidobacteraceae bacterium]
MTVHNAEIAAIFAELADLLEIREDNPFRIRAYRNAAQFIRGHGRSMSELVAAGADLSALPGIGKDLAAKIETIVSSGRLPLLELVRAKVPAPLVEMTRIEGLGPKRAKALYRALRIRSLEDLQRAARSGRIREIKGFGARTEQLIAERAARVAKAEKRIRLADADEIAGPLVEYLRAGEAAKEVVVAGSYRRRRETVGDLDVLVSATRAAAAMDRAVHYEDVAEVVAHGPTRATVRLRNGLQVDIRVVPPASYGAALYYFTGSKAHNIAVRKIAQARGLKLNEYGVFRGEERVGGRTENEVFDAVGLPYIPPELREDRGEIGAARRKRLPVLVTQGDIRGDLHCHTRATDGRDTIEAMAKAAAAMGYEYVAINDHSQRVTMAHGLDRRRLMTQVRAIDRLNEKLDGIVVLKSVEVDILDDGRLDLPDTVLKELDFTVCAIHYGLDRSREQQTQRVLRAMDNPYFTILAHPTGRLINAREPYDIDLERVFEAAKERGRILELNAHPDRLDLDDRHCRMAKEAGVRVAISTDAHRASDLALMRYGIGQARRGWLEPADVVNTRGLKELRKLLRP